jgi:hypothetical protein
MEFQGHPEDGKSNLKGTQFQNRQLVDVLLKYIPHCICSDRSKLTYLPGFLIYYCTVGALLYSPYLLHYLRTPHMACMAFH